MTIVGFVLLTILPDLNSIPLNESGFITYVGKVCTSTFCIGCVGILFGLGIGCAGIGVGQGGFWMGATCIGCCIFGFMGSASVFCGCGGGRRVGGLKPGSNYEIFEGYCG
jgi:hypothetical protein